MITPDLKTFKGLLRKGNLIAVSCHVPADLETPVSSFLKLAEKIPHAFLLESAEQEERIGRYSFIGLKPEAVLTAKNGKIYLTPSRSLPLHPAGGGLGWGKVRVRAHESITGVMQKMLGTFRLANPESLPAFCGGFVGYLSYENVVHFENIRLRPKNGPPVPDSIFFLTQDLLIFDHFRKTLSVVCLVPVHSQREAEKAYRKAVKKIDGIVRKLRKPFSLPPAFVISRPKAEKSYKREISRLRLEMTRSEFCKKVEKIKAYIRAGDCIQVVLSQRFSQPIVQNDFHIYRALRSINPSPYMFYFRAGKFRLIGSSPEMLVKKTGREVELRPIAGTRPRGHTPAEDQNFEENLKKSPKEMAEHLMLVDLGRNDLGRVCDFDTIRVKNFARVERYSHVMHLVSDITGRLKRGRTAFDLLKAAFPAGTVTGAPKIRAMQIIDELEPGQRGPYAGCLGYFSFNEDMDMCITIRTLVLDGKKMHLQAGAGIVKDSSPAREYAETLNKAKAVWKAVAARGEF